MVSKEIFANAKKALIIKPRGIGDVILSTPLIENLKKYYPHLQVDFFCELFAADTVRGNPWVSNVVTYDSKNESSIALILKIRSRNYDLIIDLYANPRTALITKLSGAKYRIGFPFRGRAYAYNILITPRSGKVHNIDFNLDVLRFFQPDR